jgi:hypothetical protein
MGMVICAQMAVSAANSAMTAMFLADQKLFFFIHLAFP